MSCAVHSCNIDAVFVNKKPWKIAAYYISWCVEYEGIRDVLFYQFCIRNNGRLNSLRIIYTFCDILVFLFDFNLNVFSLSDIVGNKKYGFHIVVFIELGYNINLHNSFSINCWKGFFSFKFSFGKFYIFNTFIEKLNNIRIKGNF